MIYFDIARLNVSHSIWFPIYGHSYNDSDYKSARNQVDCACVTLLFGCFGHAYPSFLRLVTDSRTKRSSSDIGSSDGIDRDRINSGSGEDMIDNIN